MCRLISLLFSSTVALVVAAPVCAQGTGRSLDIQPGGRANAMGAAGVTVTGDPSDAVWWNPAALGFARRPSVQLTYARLVPGLAPNVRYRNAAAASPIADRVGVGLGYTYLDYGTPGGFFPNPAGAFASDEKSPCASVGVALLPNVAVGLTAKWIRIHLLPAYGSGVSSTFGLDVGALYRQTIDPLTFSFGANVQNLGPEMHFVNDDTRSPLSRNLKVGASLQVHTLLGTEGLELGAVTAFDFNQSLVTEDFRTYHGGGEIYGGIQNLGRVSLRGGYYSDPLGEIEDFTFGAGLRIIGLTLDAGWIPQARNSGLDRVRKYTIGYHFDPLPKF